MYNIKNSILVISTIIFSFGLSCYTQDTVTPDKSPTTSKDQYLITTNGDINNLSQNTIDTEYGTFLFLPLESNRKIFLGGKFPQNIPEANIVWLTNSTIWNGYSVDETSINSTKVDGVWFYTCSIMPPDIPIYNGNNSIDEYTIQADVGYGISPPYSSYGNKAFKIKIGPLDARDWNLDVYQQSSYNTLDIVGEEILAAFGYDNMNVTINLTNSNSTLNDLIVNYNFDPINPPSPNNNTLVKYAYDILYPGLDTQAAIETYSTEHPNIGLLFFIKDYNVTTTYTDPDYGGLTLASYTNLGRKPAISFIFVKRIKDTWNPTWENIALKYTTIHELGHLWCDNLTDNSHSLWHNGKNKEKNECVMNTGLLVNQNHEPSNQDNDRTKNILNNRRFCSGHLQRGMNVSWKLKQYVPYGQNQTEMVKEQYTSNRILQRSIQDDKLEIIISSPKEDYIKGELIDAFVRIKNNSSDTLKFNYSNFNLVTDKSDTVTQQAFNDGFVRIVVPDDEIKFLLSPLETVAFKDDGSDMASLPWYYWPDGNYQYYFSIIVDGNKYFSNKIPISIKPVPDSLKQAFSDLKNDLKNPDILNFETYKCERFEALFEKYKGSFYEREYYHKLLLKRNYFDAIADRQEGKKIRVKALELYTECILKYPNSYTSYELFNRLLYPFEKNKYIIDGIMNTLKTKNSSCLLLQALENQAKNWNKKLECYFK